MTRRRKSGSSKAGRKRTDGERYPCGKKKPIKPNPKVVALRRALLGRDDLPVMALAAAENPLDLMLARGWLEARLHRAARDYAALVERAGLKGPAMRTAQFEKLARSFDAGSGDASAMATLRELWAQMRPAEAQALHEVCVRESWPEWLIFRLAGRDVPPAWDAKRERLIGALERVRAAQRKRSSR
jgi:hypothetical protein